ncbi:uncharacterized protein [Aegilops tauschii subsp. strangulata]|uniref:DUF4220 domain-containing protein n=1 Tax=Aegilops tauschii subsp. strangulata TaxID=200361 RepID=A0A453MJ72_AEGTS|nr:uncharacterized protein LOC109769644 [Aegilops tauschii subsp. strangulata]
MGISGAVEWWEEWQLRILVLASLFLQWILFISSTLRKLALPSWFRSLIWLTYLGSDALAIYALATLFSRQRKQDYGSANSDSILEVVWAPVLLVHLGGQDGITAYNIEDNELWTRHVLTAVSQITVAIYVFCKSWPGGDKRLLQASILFFVLGILKCIEKPWALKSASFSSLVSLADPYLNHRRMARRAAIKAARPPWLVRYQQRLNSLFPEATIKADSLSRMVSRIGKDILLEDYVQKARAFVLADCRSQARVEGGGIDHQHSHVPLAQEANEVDLEGNHHRQAQGKDNEADGEPDHVPQSQEEHGEADLELNHVPRAQKEGGVADPPNHVPEAQGEGDRVNRLIQLGRLDLDTRKLFVDLASSNSDRLTVLEFFLAHEAYASLQGELFKMFDLLYTKAKMITMFAETPTTDGITSMSFFSGCVRLAAIFLPLAAIGLFHKSRRDAYNINDVQVTYTLFCCTAVLEYISMSTVMFVSALMDAIIPSGMVAQYSLVGFLIRNKRHSKKMCILSSLNCKDFLDQRLCTKSCSSSSRITKLVLQHVKGWWKEHIIDAASYRRFSDHRGQWTIQRKECDESQEWGLNRSFDESVLLWHIATDLCFYQKGDTSASHGNATECREISSYMIYLLFVKPEMLLPGARRSLFKTANAELEEFLKDDEASVMEILKGKGTLPEETEKRFVDRIVVKLQRTECREEVTGCTELPPDAEKYPALRQGLIIHDAWKISKMLLALGDEKKMWEVIEGVWVEMLCFSASRCRGFLHARSLGTGGELLTYIWLLLSHMGMETLPERVQRRDLSSGGGNTDTTPSTSQIPGSEDARPLKRQRPHEAAGAGASTSRPEEIQPAE